jgi:hypothetical protein
MSSLKDQSRGCERRQYEEDPEALRAEDSLHL